MFECYLFKSNLDRGGFIKNIHIDDVQCDSARSAFIRFENNYHGSRGGRHPTRFSNFMIRNVTCNYSGEVAIYAVGIQKYPLKNISLKKVTVLHTPKDQIIKNVQQLRYNDILVNGIQIKKAVNTGFAMLHTD